MTEEKVKKEPRAVVTISMSQGLADIIKVRAKAEKRKLSQYLSIVLADLYNYKEDEEIEE